LGDLVSLLFCPGYGANFRRATRTFGTIIGLHMFWGFGYYFWPAGHAYFMTPFSIFLWSSGLAADLIYPFVFHQIRKTEKVLPDGRKAPGNGVRAKPRKNNV